MTEDKVREALELLRLARGGMVDGPVTEKHWRPIKKRIDKFLADEAALATPGAQAGEWQFVVDVFDQIQMRHDDAGNWLRAEQCLEKMAKTGLAKFDNGVWLAAGRAAAPGSLSEEQVWNAALLEAAKALCCHCGQGLAVECSPTAPKVLAHCVGGQRVHCYAWAIHKLFRAPAGAPSEKEGA